jgi:hypothetical protein
MLSINDHFTESTTTRTGFNTNFCSGSMNLAMQSDAKLETVEIISLKWAIILLRWFVNLFYGISKAKFAETCENSTE